MEKFPTGGPGASHGARKTSANPRKGKASSARRIQRCACDHGGRVAGRSAVGPLASRSVADLDGGDVHSCITSSYAAWARMKRRHRWRLCRAYSIVTLAVHYTIFQLANA